MVPFNESKGQEFIEIIQIQVVSSQRGGGGGECIPYKRANINWKSDNNWRVRVREKSKNLVSSYSLVHLKLYASFASLHEKPENWCIQTIIAN